MKDDGEIIEKEHNKLDKKQLGECEFGSLKEEERKKQGIKILLYGVN